MPWRGAPHPWAICRASWRAVPEARSSSVPPLVRAQTGPAPRSRPPPTALRGSRAGSTRARAPSQQGRPSRRRPGARAGRRHS
eukprot:scaffold105392_cov30-Tisochrysis_lutea.AAC.3